MIRGASRLYGTPAYPAGSGPDFINAAFLLATDLSCDALLERLHGIEARFGRQRSVRWGPRTLDLDLLAMDDLVVPDRGTYKKWADLPLEVQVRSAPEHLILPHPRLHERAFVLVPLAEVAPDWRHPVFGLTVRQMFDALPAADKAAVQPLESALVNPVAKP